MTRRILYPLILIILLWQLLHMLIGGGGLIPAPLSVLGLLLRMLGQKALWLHTGSSLLRIAGGISAALIVGIPLGMAAGISGKTDRLVSPLLYIFYPLPKIAFLPVFMVLFGLGNLSKIILIWSVIVFQIIIAARDGIKEISPAHIKAMRTLGLSRGQFFTDLYFPSSLPRILTAVRVSLGISISVLFFAENYAASWGIGYFIMNSWIMVDYTRMFAGIVMISLLGLGLFHLLDRLERLLCPWLYVHSPGGKQKT
ncbi:MAG: ABC transporter permease [Spirochaetaceae bacterium]